MPTSTVIIQLACTLSQNMWKCWMFSIRLLSNSEEAQSILKFLFSDLPSQKEWALWKTAIVLAKFKNSEGKKKKKKHSSPGIYFSSSGNQPALLYSSMFCMFRSLVYKVTSSTQLFLFFFPFFSPKVTLNYFKTPSLQKWFNQQRCNHGNVKAVKNVLNAVHATRVLV